MTADNKPDKMPSPDPLAPAENNSFLSEETDADDAIHQQPPTVTEENKQQDPDDAVHKTPQSLPGNDPGLAEQDPDSAVHSG